MSINLSCHSEEHPKGTCFAARSDVGIRNLLVANSRKSVKIVRFGNGLPRQSADWLAMTGFFGSLKGTPTGRSLFTVEEGLCPSRRHIPALLAPLRRDGRGNDRFFSQRGNVSPGGNKPRKKIRLDG